MDDLEGKIKNTNWSSFDGPGGYQSDRVSDALIALLNLVDSGSSEDVYRGLMVALCNDHAGEYFPAIMSAVHYIIGIEKSSEENSPRSNCSWAFLNNIYFFNPNLGNYNAHSHEEVKKYMQEKLYDYSDKKF